MQLPRRLDWHARTACKHATECTTSQSLRGQASQTQPKATESAVVLLGSRHAGDELAALWSESPTTSNTIIMDAQRRMRSSRQRRRQ